MRSHTTKTSRRRGRLWAAAVVGALLGAAATAALNTPWRPSVSGGGLNFHVAWIDSKGVLKEGWSRPDETARPITVGIRHSVALRGENAVWQRITVRLTPDTPVIPGQLVPDAASIARESDFRANIRIPIAPHDIPWERVMAGQPYTWLEPGWPEVRRIAVISGAAGVGAGAAMYGIAAIVQYRLRKPGRCGRCGYDLTGLGEAAPCPECGKAY